MTTRTVKRTGIPIPSFGAVDGSPMADGPPKLKEMPSSKASTSIAAANRCIHWKMASFMQLEVSLQHWFRRRHQGSHPNKEQVATMSLDDFFALVGNLDWSQTKAKDAMANNNKDSKKPPAKPSVDLTFEEQLLHDLLCLAAHPAMEDPLYYVDITKKELKLVPHSADQLRPLVASTTKLDSHWSQSVVAMISSYRKAKEEPKKVSSKQAIISAKELPCNQSAAAASNNVIRKTMTIDERVRAKAHARQQHEQLLRERHQRDAGTNQKKQLHADKTWTVKMADALSLHARSLVHRNNRHIPNQLASRSLLYNSRGSKSQKKEQQSSTCILPFRDVVNIIAKSRLGEASAQQIQIALMELAQYKPSFVHVKHGGTTGGNSKASSKWCKKTTTVHINPDHYPSVRSQLTGQPSLKASSISLHTSNTSLLAGTSLKTAAAPANGKRKQHDNTPVFKNLLNAFDKANKRSKTTVTPSPANNGAPGIIETPVNTRNNNNNNNLKKRKRGGPVSSRLLTLPTPN